MVKTAKRTRPSIAHEQPINKKRRKSTPSTLAHIRGRLEKLSNDELGRLLKLREQAYNAAVDATTQKQNALQKAKDTVTILEKEMEETESQEIAARESLANISAARQARQAMDTEARKHLHLKSLEKDMQKIKDEEAENKEVAENRMNELDGVDLEALFAEPGNDAMAPQQHQEEQHESEHEQWGQEQAQDDGESQSSLSSLSSQSVSGVNADEKIDLYAGEG